MQAINKLMQFTVAVSDMPKAREFYVDKLGLKVTMDYCRDDANWWVTLALPESGPVNVLTSHHEHMKPGTMTLWFATCRHRRSPQRVQRQRRQSQRNYDDLHGPGSGIKWFNFRDPDGNLIHLEQA